ncbi:MAG: FeoB small GTPase domain-containing protein, partial [Coriobacteriales bacterium]
MSLTIALVGNPNSGKTTLFNQLTGTNQHVGNWPGVTVEKKYGTLNIGKRRSCGSTCGCCGGCGSHASQASCEQASVVDLPGIYSLSPYSKEELITRSYLASGEPSVILNIVDATNLERSLYLTTQLMEFGVPVVVALNQMDLVRKRGYTVRTKELSAQLGVPVVEVSALHGSGVSECASAALRAGREQAAPQPVRFYRELEAFIARIDEQLPAECPQALRRYCAVKLLEGDAAAAEEYAKQSSEQLAAVAAIREQATAQLGDETDALVVDARYRYIGSFIERVYKRSAGGAGITEKIDRVVTNRFLALPIFAAVIALVYYIAISTVGGLATDWANDGVFGDGWFLDPAPIVGIDGAQAGYDEEAGAFDEAQACITEYLTAASEEGVAGADKLLASFEAGEELDEAALASFQASAEAAGIEAVYTPEDEESGELLSDEAIAVDAAVFAESLEVAEPNPSSFGLWIPGIPVLVAGALEAAGITGGWLHDLVLDGIVAGVGSVLGFVPQILILFLMLAALEGCGYMARVAFILDRLFRRFGLSGKTFIPMLIGTGCGVPAIMATRTIESESARRLTIMTTTFMPCSAKLPIIALFAGAFFGGSGLIATLAYFAGIAAVVCSGIILKKAKPFRGEETPFIMELPEYRLPRVADVLRSMWERGWSFIKKAGTIILASVVLVWFMSNYGWENGVFGAVENMDNSVLAMLGSAVCIVFAPLGWGDWQATAASVTGLIAKENLVGTMGVLYGGGDGLWINLAATYSVPAALSLLFFNLLCAPCFAAMGAIRREQGSARWFWASIGWQCGFAYAVALTIYQLGSAATGTGTMVGAVAGIAVLAVFIFLLVRPPSPSSPPPASPRQPKA